MRITPFEIHVPDDVLHDLRERLERFRPLPDSPRRPVSGMTTDYLRELVASWADFDWRARERWLNSHPQVLVDVDGTTVHAVHRRASAVEAPAVLVMHGWPHTFALQLEFADRLDDFHVVVPSLPGFAFSPAYADRPFTVSAVAQTMHALMTDGLGYDEYFVYGEDVTADVNDLLAATHPDAVLGEIVTHAHFGTPAERSTIDDPAVAAFFDRRAAESGRTSGYAHVQGTRPDTLAAALNDSPPGLLAWLTEKFVEWADADDSDPVTLERRISRERILTEATIYWATQSIGTSFRPYHEGDDAHEPIPAVTVPASVHIQKHEAEYPEALARAFYRDLRTFERLEEGGHFTIAEVPGAMADRLRALAMSVRR